MTFRFYVYDFATIDYWMANIQIQLRKRNLNRDFLDLSDITASTLDISYISVYHVLPLCKIFSNVEISV